MTAGSLTRLGLALLISLAAAPPLVATAASLAQPGTVRAVAEEARPAVVQITTQQAVPDVLSQANSLQTGVGSGVIYDAAGLILTNSHVVDQSNSMLVSLPDGRTYPGTLLGQDPVMDLAVVKIEPAAGESLPVATLGDSSEVRVGDEVVAIGNALSLPGGPTVTAGIVSALDRAVQEPADTAGVPGSFLYDLIQTDAAINPGNSGGPLLNMNAEVVGINTLVAGRAGNTMAQGVGFAISINTAKPIAAQLAAGKAVLHPYLGVGYLPLSPSLAWRLGVTTQQGLLVTYVAPGSPAEGAGIRQRDIVVQVDDQAMRDETTLGRLLSRHVPGDVVRLTVDRSGTSLTFDVTLGERSQ